MPDAELQRLLAAEPHVRALARALCADGDDVAQQAWVLALRHGAPGIDDARAWLSRIVRNLASNVRRDDGRRRARERAAAADELVPSSQELALREERRRSLVAAVDRLPRDLRTVVLLRYFDGLPPRAIAQRLGVPATTVWSRLRNALQRLRADLDERHGDRRAWLVPLTGGFLMTAKAKFGGAAAVLTAAALVVLFALQAAPPVAHGDGASSPAVLAQQGDVHRDPPTPTVATRDDAQREPVAEPPPAATAPATGALLVRARRPDGEPAFGVTVVVRPRGSDVRFASIRQVTDEDGEARFEGLRPGTWSITNTLAPGGTRAEVEAGATAVVDYELRAGITLTGVVLDPTGHPVPGASVEVIMPIRVDADAETIATTGAEGQFVVFDVVEMCLVGARAPGFTASRLHYVELEVGAIAEVELRLGEAGGMVEGVVLAAHGAPVPAATVIIGSGATTGLRASPSVGAPPLPALVHTDADGRFRAVGVSPGTQPVRVRAAEFAPWAGTCEVFAAATTSMPVVLQQGGAVRGTVRDGTGAPVAEALVAIGTIPDFGYCRTRSAADGGFELTGLAAGECELRVEHESHLRATQRIVVREGVTVACAVVLVRGLDLRGRVVDGHGVGVEGAIVAWFGEGPASGGTTDTDAAGCFHLARLPGNGSISLSVRGNDIEPMQRSEIDPRVGDVELRVRRVAKGDAGLRGAVADADGMPVANASVFVHQGRARSATTRGDGSFELAELEAGPWSLFVAAPDHPWLHANGELTAGVSTDLGTLRLPRGGTAVVDVDADAARVHVTIVDALGRRACDTRVDGTRHTSGPLAEGDHVARIAGEGIAMQAVPFSVRAGEQTRVPVRSSRAVRQRVELVLLRTEAGSVAIDVLQDDLVVGRKSVRISRTEPCQADLWLAPGTYTLRAEAGPVTGRVACTVGAAEGPPLRIVLQ